MSDLQPMILVHLDYNKAIVLPFDDKGVAIANFIREAPLHAGSNYGPFQFTPYTGDPITVSTVQMEMDPSGAYHDAIRRESDLYSKVRDLEKKIEEQTETSRKTESTLRGQLNSVCQHLREIEPVDAGLTRGDSPKVKAAKRNKALARANEALAEVRKLGGGDS